MFVDGKSVHLATDSVYISILYEIYPQSETPLLTQIAHLDCNKIPVHLLTDTLIFWDFRGRVFRVWDYRANYSRCFAADIEVKRYCYELEVFSVLSKTLKLV
jgi:hypothetical protein